MICLRRDAVSNVRASIVCKKEKKLFSSKTKKGWTPRGKEGERVYAIGDIHGCLEETKTLLEKIKTDDDYRDEAKTHLIFLGDLIDRGPDSRGVVELLMDFPFRFATPLFIKGNHEEMMVQGLMQDPELLPSWLKYGGYACAESYGLSVQELVGRPPEDILRILRSAIPKRHVEFMDGFLDYVQFGDFVFTHAGVRPGIPLENQNSRELRWIREPFLSFEGDHGIIVVHGHTVSNNVEVKHNRIGLDTGAYETGRLSAICIENDKVSQFST